MPASVKPKVLTDSAEAAEFFGGSNSVLLRVFETLERAAVRYCVSHGYDKFHAELTSDVDCIVEKSVTPRDLLALFRQHRAFIGADVVRSLGFYFVFASRRDDGAYDFLALDFSHDCSVNDVVLCDGASVLATCRRYGPVHIPSPDMEFACYLARSVEKEALGAERVLRLTALFGQDPQGCAARIERCWSQSNAEIILAAVRSGDWAQVRGRLGQLRLAQRRRAIVRHPVPFVYGRFNGVLRRVRQLWRPAGVSVVLLGPDGAGKSSAIEALGSKLEMVFPRSTCRGFAPGLLSLFRRGARSTSEPHGRPPRSLAVSLVRLAYWFVFQVVDYLAVRVALSRATLVLYDRHYLDILVDQKRYRFGGPVWTLRLLWRLIPKPDLVVLLDAPAEVLQMRKQEVALEVTASQRAAYNALVRTLPNGHIVNAAASPGQVANAISTIILDCSVSKSRLGASQGQDR